MFYSVDIQIGAGIRSRDPSLPRRKAKNKKNQRKNPKNSAETTSDEKATKTSPTPPIALDHRPKIRKTNRKINQKKIVGGREAHVKISREKNEDHGQKKNASEESVIEKRKQIKNSDINLHRLARVPTTGEIVPMMQTAQVTLYDPTKL